MTDCGWDFSIDRSLVGFDLYRDIVVNVWIIEDVAICIGEVEQRPRG